MGDIRELLPRMNPASAKFDVVRGGVSELTSTDIAGGLGFVKNKLGREVLEACWWPDGAELRWKELREAVLAVVESELSRQIRQVQKARVDLQIAESNSLWPGQRRSCDKSLIVSCRQRLEHVKENCWPRNTLEKLPLIAVAVMKEMRGRRCDTCVGTRNVTANNLVISCPSCEGQGWFKHTDKWRAEEIKVDPSDYPKRWRKVYEWVYDQMRNAEADAASELREAVFGGGG